MKRVNLISGIIFVVMILTGTTMAKAGDAPLPVTGNSLTVLGNYQISELEPEIIDKETFRKFRLDYENGSAPVTILLNERKRCNEYIVRSKVMEIQYVCKKSGFGASAISSKYSQYPEQTNNMFLSREALNNQEKIVNKEISVEKALSLIGCYYPALLKNVQNIAAN